MHFWLWLTLIFISGYLLGSWVSSVIFAAYLVYQIHKSIIRTRNWFNPIFFFNISILISTIANLKILYLFETGIFLNSYRYAKPELFDEAALIWSFGNFFIVEAFGHKPRFKLPQLEWNLNGASWLNLLFLLSVAMIFRKLWLPFSVPGAFENVLHLFPLVGIIMHASIAELNANPKIYIKALILTVLATIYSVLFSYLRIEMIIPTLVFLLGSLSANKNIRLLGLPRFYPLYGFLILFMIYFTTFGSIRTQLSSGVSRIMQLQESHLIEDEVITERSLTPFERSSSIAQISALVNLVQDNGHYRGRASEPLLIAFIPRILWPEKPKIALGVWFALEIGVALQRADGWYNTSINMTVPGNLFLDFGWFGLIIGCWLVGTFLRMLWQTTNFHSRPLNFTGSLLAGYLLYNCFFGLGANLQIFITLLAVYLITLVIDRALNMLISNRRLVPLSREPQWSVKSGSIDV